MAREPTTELHPEFSSPGATAVPWSEAPDRLTLAEIFWISTVRPDARPHVTPLVAVWLDDALFFVTEETERKATNLTYNPHAVMTTGCAAFRDGFDIVIEGDAIRATGSRSSSASRGVRHEVRLALRGSRRDVPRGARPGSLSGANLLSPRARLRAQTDNGVRLRSRRGVQRDALAILRFTAAVTLARDRRDTRFGAPFGAD